jgi:hypothetical protein
MVFLSVIEDICSCLQAAFQGILELSASKVKVAPVLSDMVPPSFV